MVSHVLWFGGFSHDCFNFCKGGSKFDTKGKVCLRQKLLEGARSLVLVFHLSGRS